MFLWIWNENFSVFSFLYFIIFHLDSEPSQDWKPQNLLWNGTSASCTALIASQWVPVKITCCFPCLSDTRLLNNSNIFGCLKPLNFCIDWYWRFQNDSVLGQFFYLFMMYSVARQGILLKNFQTCMGDYVFRKFRNCFVSV